MNAAPPWRAGSQTGASLEEMSKLPEMYAVAAVPGRFASWKPKPTPMEPSPKKPPPDVQPPPGLKFPYDVMAMVSGMDAPNKMDPPAGVWQTDNTMSGGGAAIGGSAGGCTCSLPYKPQSVWWTEKKGDVFYGEAVEFLSMAWKSIVNAAALKGKPKPLAPCCCKCTAAKRVACQYECMTWKKQGFEAMYEGHKHERSHWVWCGFACLSCEYKSKPALPSCTEDEVTARDMDKVPLEGDDKTLPAWWMGIMRNTVISSQKVQGITTEAEACDLGEVNEGAVSKGLSDGMNSGAGAGAAGADKGDKSKCGFMCKMKQTAADTKQASTDASLDDKGVKVSKESIESQARELESDELERAQTAAAARMSEKDSASQGVFAKKLL